MENKDYLIRFHGALLVNAKTKEEALQKFAEADNALIGENVDYENLEAEIY